MGRLKSELKAVSGVHVGILQQLMGWIWSGMEKLKGGFVQVFRSNSFFEIHVLWKNMKCKVNEAMVGR